MTNQLQPIFILPEGKSREKGKEAQRTNIKAAKLVADTVRTTLGPKGMDKMLVSGMGDITITNDGVTILKEMNIEHPSAKIIVEIAKTQEKEAGDGTTTAVVIAGELLKKAENLLEMKIHPTVVAKGYRLAADKAVEILNKFGENVAENDKKALMNVAMTAMTGKSAEIAKEYLANIAVNAVLDVADKEDNRYVIDKNNIKIEKKPGERIEQSELIQGIILDKERAHPGMPRVVENAKILLVDAAIEIKDTETKAKIKIRDPMQIQSFFDQEEIVLRDIVEKISKYANTVFCQKGIDDRAQHLLSKKGIYAIRRVRKSDMEALARATGAAIITNFNEINESDMGYAGKVEEIKIEDNMTIIRDCKHAKSVSILLRGATAHVLEELKRALEDAIGVLSSVVSGGKIVGGSGSVEIEVARQLRRYTESLSGREQLAARAFADAIEVIPVTLAENAGLDAINILAELKAAHDKGNKWHGINAFTGKTMDAWKEGILEPLKIKTQAISSATEVAIMILRIDDIIASSKPSKAEQQMQMPSAHGMQGMGMPPMM